MACSSPPISNAVMLGWTKGLPSTSSSSKRPSKPCSLFCHNLMKESGRYRMSFAMRRNFSSLVQFPIDSGTSFNLLCERNNFRNSFNEPMFRGIDLSSFRCTYSSSSFLQLVAKSSGSCVSLLYDRSKYTSLLAPCPKSRGKNVRSLCAKLMAVRLLAKDPENTQVPMVSSLFQSQMNFSSFEALFVPSLSSLCMVRIEL
mmetsp:Transcript_42576/g.108169  ORF Transcript_42576/g.108169 Transcript_42576/m.108169 type:complete len:200 (-) Transcript_42576:272-871(-)